MRYIDLGLLVVLGLLGGIVSGSFSFGTAFPAATFLLAVFSGVALIRRLIGIPGRTNPLCLLPLLVWPGFFSLSGPLAFSWLGLLAIAGFSIAVFLDKLEGGWKKALPAAIISIATPILWWVLPILVPAYQTSLLPGTLTLRVGVLAAGAMILLLAQGDEAARLLDPRGIALAGVVLLGFSLGYRFLSGIYISVRSFDYLALMAPMLSALFAGASARSRNPIHLALCLAWAGFLGTLGFALALGPCLALILLARERNLSVAFGIGGGLFIYLGAMAWAREGVLGFVPPGLAIGLAIMFFMVALARPMENRWVRAILTACGYLGLAILIRNWPMFILSLAGAIIGFIVALVRPKLMWWFIAVFTLALSCMSFVSPWSFRERPEGLETALAGRGSFQAGDYPEALEKLSRSQIGPTDCILAAKAAAACGQEPTFLYERGLVDFPSDRNIYLSYIGYLYTRGHEGRLILWSHKAILAGIVDPFVLRALGKGLLLAGQYTEAAQAFFSEFLLGDPNGLVYLADIYQKPELFRKAREAGADFNGVYRDLVQIHLRRGDKQRAIYYLDALLATYPKDTGLSSLRDKLGN
ncbi:MAG: hypothetical protein ACP5QG_05335 [candidate division WOR-3 bacterium]